MVLVLETGEGRGRSVSHRRWSLISCIPSQLPVRSRHVVRPSIETQRTSAVPGTWLHRGGSCWNKAVKRENLVSFIFQDYQSKLLRGAKERLILRNIPIIGELSSDLEIDIREPDLPHTRSKKRYCLDIVLINPKRMNATPHQTFERRL